MPPWEAVCWPYGGGGDLRTEGDYGCVRLSVSGPDGTRSPPDGTQKSSFQTSEGLLLSNPLDNNNNNTSRLAIFLKRMPIGA